MPFREEIAVSLRRRATDAQYHRILRDLNYMKRRDPMVLVVSSLLGTHSTSKQVHTVRLNSHAHLFLALGKFARSLRRIRGEVSGHKQALASLYIEEHARVSWEEDPYHFKGWNFNVFIIPAELSVNLVVWNHLLHIHTYTSK